LTIVRSSRVIRKPNESVRRIAHGFPCHLRIATPEVVSGVPFVSRPGVPTGSDRTGIRPPTCADAHGYRARPPPGRRQPGTAVQRNPRLAGDARRDGT
jgi:hypothetical protein